MHIRFILIGTCIALTFGCTNPQPKPSNSAQSDAKPQISGSSNKNITAEPLKNETMRDQFTCKRDTDIRSIWIESLQPKGCKLWYSNYNKKGPSAWSEVGLIYCQKISENIRENLKVAGFSCQAAKNAIATK